MTFCYKFITMWLFRPTNLILLPFPVLNIIYFGISKLIILLGLVPAKVFWSIESIILLGPVPAKKFLNKIINYLNGNANFSEDKSHGTGFIMLQWIGTILFLNLCSQCFYIPGHSFLNCIHEIFLDKVIIVIVWNQTWFIGANVVRAHARFMCGGRRSGH